MPVLSAATADSLLRALGLPAGLPGAGHLLRNELIGLRRSP